MSEPVSPADTIRRADNESIALWRKHVGHLELGAEVAVRLADERDALLAVVERDKAEIEALADRAVCSGCGSDVAESGECDYQGCDAGEMIPASGLPQALRAKCDRLMEERREWDAEIHELTIAAERDRQQIVRLTEALERAETLLVHAREHGFNKAMADAYDEYWDARANG